MMNLSDREWHSFLLNDLFIVESGKDIVLDDNNGNLPYINSSGINNGITNHVRSGKKIQEYFVSIARTGTVGSTFYHDYKAVVSGNVRTLRPKNFNFNKYLGMFFASVINFNVRDRFSYGNILGTKRIKNLKLKLPVDDNKQPDYDFMEQYIKEKYFDLKSQIKEKQKHEINEWRELNEVEWKTYFIEDIFQIKSGKRLTKKDFIQGSKPFIGSSESNNGITNYVGNQNSSEDYNVLGVNYNGSVVENFYHPYRALFSDDVKRLSIKTGGNKYIYLFVKNVILQQKGKYQYGYKFNATRMKKQIIKLPSKNNHPDYEFMEGYMKRKENEVLDKL